MERVWKMAKYKARLSFVACVEIEAGDLEDARLKAENMITGRSVYEDNTLQSVHDDAYYAGASGYDPPLIGKRANSMRDQEFEPSFAILDSGGKPIISCWKGTKDLVNEA